MLKKTKVTIRFPKLANEVTISEEFLERRDSVVKRATDLGGIRNDAEYAVAAQLLREATKMNTAFEQKRKDFSKPFQDMSKMIKQVVDETRQPLEEVKASIKEWIVAYTTKRDEEIRKEREAEEEKQRQEILEQEREHEKLVESGLVDEKEDFQPEVPTPAAVIEPSAKPLGLKEWHKLLWDVADEAKVPVGYKSVDSKKINAWIKDNKDIILKAVFAGHGNRIVPGIIFKAEKTVMT